VIQEMEIYRSLLRSIMPLRKRRVSLNCLKKLSPRRPSTPLSVGKSWHKTSRLVTLWPMAVAERTIVRGAYSMPLPVTMRCRSNSGFAGSYPSRAIMSVAKIVKRSGVENNGDDKRRQETNDHLRLRLADQQRWTRPRDRTPLGALENNRGIG
jgi:hypothetical protein